MSSLPTRLYAGVTVPNTPLITSALAHAHAHLTPPLYNHIIRSWLLGFIIADQIPAFQSRDRELHSLAAILHDLGWDHTGTLVSQDKRFEVDGANAAREFVLSSSLSGDEGNLSAQWDERRLQLLWDAVALHATPSIVAHKEPEVAATCLGIAADLFGPGGEGPIPDGVLTEREWEHVVREVPREGFKEAFKGVMCGLCATKPATTWDCFVGEWGERYVRGYKRERVIDGIEGGVERLGG